MKRLTPRARVHDAVQQVGNEIPQHHHRGGDYRDPGDNRVVPPVDRVHRELAHSRPREHGFDQHRAREQEWEEEPEQSDYRKQGVAQSVPYEYGGSRQSLGPSGPDEVLVHHLEQFGALIAGDDRGAHQAERERRKHEVLQAVREASERREVRVNRFVHDAAYGEPAEPHPEQHQQHHAEPEYRHRVEPERRDREDVVRAGAGTRRLHRPGQDAQPERDDERGRREDQSGRDARCDRGCSGAVLAERVAEVALNEVPQVARVLYVQGLVQPEVAALLLDDLRGNQRGLAERREGVSRREMQQEESQRGDQEHDRGRVRQPDRDEAQHPSSWRP